VGFGSPAAGSPTEQDPDGLAVSSGSRRSSTAIVAIITAGVVAVVAIGALVFIQVNKGTSGAKVAGSPVSSTTTVAPTSTTTPRTFAQVFAAESSGVVRVDVTGCGQAGVGTGFLVGPNLVATAAHVVEGSAQVTLLSGQTTSLGEVVGLDTISDVALVRAMSPLDGYEFHLGGHSPAVGTPVAAIGFPEGQPLALTEGAVSAVNRSVQSPDGVTRSGLIQTDAALNPGNSGGPLVTPDGTVVGIVEGGLSTAQGIGYATGAEIARPLLSGWIHSPHPVSLSSCGFSGSEGADSQAALALVQEWANALASGDWPTARQLNPALAQTSDSALQSGYGGLKEATIAYVSGTPDNLSVASVAYEDVGAGPRTNVYCYQMSVDLTASTLNVLSQRRATPSSISGWVDPSTLSDVIATC
jgi:S1-C subfamily serine protease